MKLQEKEKRRRLLERSSAEPAGKLSKAAASEKLRQLTRAGKASLLKVSQPARGAGPLGGAWQVWVPAVHWVAEPTTPPTCGCGGPW